MRVTASKTGLLTACQRWARDDIEWTYTTSPAAARGVAYHTAMENYVVSGVLPADEESAALVAATLPWLEQHQGARLAEVAFAYNVNADTCAVVDVEGRAYPEDRLCGRADLILPDERLVVDFKSGNGANAGPQLRTLGLMAARAYGWPDVTVLALEVTAAGTTEVCRETLDEFALAAVAGDLADLVARIPTAEPQPSEACKEMYCPAVLRCEAGSQGMTQIIPADALVRGPRFSLADPTASPEAAAWSLDILRLVVAQADAIKEAIKARVPESGWALEDGRVLRETKATIKVDDKAKLIALARGLGATEAQLEGCKYSFAKSNGLRVSGGAKRVYPKKGRAA